MEEKRAVVIDALGRWISQEMKYSPQGKFAHCAPPSSNDLRSLCRGVSIPLWDYVAHRVRSEKCVLLPKSCSPVSLTVEEPSFAISDLRLPCLVNLEL